MSAKRTEPFANQDRVAKLLQDLAADPQTLAIVREFENRASRGQGKFGSNGLKVNGKLFALFTHATLVVKLPPERVSALAAEAVGKPFDPGHGRLMKGWLEVVSPRASWLDLTNDARRFVSEAANVSLAEHKRRAKH
jgi:hypothetical protein